MRIAIVAESFLPSVNGVTNSVLRVLDHLHDRGHEALVIAPCARQHQEEISHYRGFEIMRVPSIRVPLIASLPIGVPTTTVVVALRSFAPDVVHLASPFVLGAAGVFAARQLRIPTVAVYQTDVAGFSRRYHLAALSHAAWEWTRTVHNAADLTLAPSTATIRDLEQHGVTAIRRWGRGVDAVRFHPDKRDPALRRRWDPTGRKHLVGYVGRLAAEKGVDRLAALSRRRDVQLVIVGGGPERDALERLLPDAIFTGPRSGDELARAYASLDLFVHPGEFETFCQTIQEAQASGVPTIAPRAGGPIDLIADGYNGLLLPVASFAEQLSDAATSLLAPAQLPQLRRQARAGVESRTWQAVGEQLLGYYREAIDRALGARVVDRVH